MSTRLAKVGTLLQKEFGRLLLEEVEMPLGTLVTITHVKPSVDLRYATVFVSVLPARRSASTLARLKRVLPHLQHLIGKRLIMRPIPRLKLSLDQGEKHATLIETLLAKEKLFGTRPDAPDRPQT